MEWYAVQRALRAAPSSSSLGGAEGLAAAGLAGEPDLVVIGAGPAGLCAAWEGQQLGWAVVVLDLADGPGGVWRKAPRRMQALSPRQRDRMPDGSTPLGTSDHAEAGEIQGMLEAFADGLDVDFRFGVKANGLLLPPSGQ